MNSRYILSALATAALVVGGPALAQGRGGGHGGGPGGGHGAGLGGAVHGGLGAGLGNTHMNGDIGGQTDTRVGRDFGISTRTDARMNSQGPSHANARARARANDNSVLATGRTSTDLSLLRNGLTVRSANGTTLGTIARINRTGDGRIANVLVRDGRGRTIPIAPRSLTINGDVVTTTSIRR